ncbi:proto-oncogene Mas-like [Heteronotia binoei]|uniref:proto-oncogene Mas-like n=1 Tax=Heteronotia binoei TaxID=13085 RepID=UPI0029300B50|nr:proto-oncogene Mas-like [Heteronotia binoei]
MLKTIKVNTSHRSSVFTSQIQKTPETTCKPGPVDSSSQGNPGQNNGIPVDGSDSADYLVWITDHHSSLKSKFTKVIFITVLVTSILGAVGNGMVIWLLGFCIKRSHFTTYILNLAMADSGVLLSLMLRFTFSYVSISYFAFQRYFDIVILVLVSLFLLMYSTSQFLLTAISIDRCVAVFFPLWHQCKRPPRLSTIVCALIWVFSLSLTASSITLVLLNPNAILIRNFFQLIVNAALCLPVMTIATASLFLKVRVKARRLQRGKLLTVVFLTLLFFILFAFPYNIMSIFYVFGGLSGDIRILALLLSCLNSSVNPVIYFLVGKQWKSGHKESMKMLLQKVFREEEGCAEETPVETQL